ncbi:MAG: hypothetical protein EOO15_07350 [Chitinophagaceae bacterium]|nr:MAG: hypothetical protein EOO15_07350 [Chitinophagaceae bacterium]
MKKFIAFFFMFLLLLQAIPLVPQLVADDILVSWVDEDKPQDSKSKEKKDGKEFLSFLAATPAAGAAQKPYGAPQRAIPACPYLERFIPPPNC